MRNNPVFTLVNWTAVKETVSFEKVAGITAFSPDLVKVRTLTGSFSKQPKNSQSQVVSLDTHQEFRSRLLLIMKSGIWNQFSEGVLGRNATRLLVT